MTTSLERSENPTNRLKVFEVLSETYTELSQKKAILLRTLIIAVLIMGVADFIFDKFLDSLSDEIIDGSNFFLTMTISTLVYGVAFTLFAVTCHRVILCGEGSVPKYGIIYFSWRELRFMGWVIVVNICLMIPVILMSTIMEWSLSADTSTEHSFPAIYDTLGFLLGLYFFSRLSLLLPSTAVGQKKDVYWARTTSRGNAFKLLILVGIVPALMWLLPFPFSGNSDFLDVVYILLRFILMVIEIAILSNSFKQLTGFDSAATSQ